MKKITATLKGIPDFDIPVPKELGRMMFEWFKNHQYLSDMEMLELDLIDPIDLPQIRIFRRIVNENNNLNA